MDESLREIARLEALVAGDPGASAFPALAEANRRAGRVKEAERVARDGLRQRPEMLAGRVALGLALLDLGRPGEARDELERVLDPVPDHPLAVEARALLPADGLAEIADDELDAAFADAETNVEAMVDAHDVAAEAMRAAALDDPEGVITAPESPFATDTMAGLLADQGHEDASRRVRAHSAERAARGHEPPATATPALEPGSAPAPTQRDRVVDTLERWLENLRRSRS